MELRAWVWVWALPLISSNSLIVCLCSLRRMDQEVLNQLLGSFVFEDF